MGAYDMQDTITRRLVDFFVSSAKTGMLRLCGKGWERKIPSYVFFGLPR